MKPVFVLIFFFLSPDLIHAQGATKTLKADVSGIVYVARFQKDTLVPTKRRGRTGVITEVMANGYYDFALKNPRLLYRVGLGYSQKDMIMNKWSFGDIFFAFLPFSGGRPDSFRLSSIRYTYDYLNIPLGISYRLTRNLEKWFQVQAGLQANFGFRIGGTTYMTVDPFLAQPTPSDLEKLKSIYNEGAASVVVGLLPRLDLAARIYKNVGIFYSIQFYTLQLNSLQGKIIKGGTGMGGGIGIYVNL